VWGESGWSVLVDLAALCVCVGGVLRTKWLFFWGDVVGGLTRCLGVCVLGACWLT
jgi:hypothetical protein